MLLCLSQIFLALTHKNCPRGFNRQHFFFQWKSLSFLWVKYINGKQITLTPGTLNMPNIILSAQIRSVLFVLRRSEHMKNICSIYQHQQQFIHNCSEFIAIPNHSTITCVNLANIILTFAISTHLLQSLYKGSFSDSQLPSLISNSKERMIRISSSAQFEGSSG